MQRSVKLIKITLGAPETDRVAHQIVHDITSTAPSLRVSAAERRAGAAWLRAQGGPVRAATKRQAVEMAREWPFYFARLFSAKVPPGENAVLAVSHNAVTIGVKGNFNPSSLTTRIGLLVGLLSKVKWKYTIFNLLS